MMTNQQPKPPSYSPTEYRKFILTAIVMIIFFPVFGFGLYQMDILPVQSARMLAIIGGALALLSLATLIRYRDQLIHAGGTSKPWWQIIILGLRDVFAIYGGLAMLIDSGVTFDSPMGFGILISVSIIAVMIIGLMRYANPR